ncbi:MAG: ABC transporter ATP-binding protein, partial [Acidobacteriota bacterium]
MSDFAVNVQNLSKRFKLYNHPWHRALDWCSLGHVARHTDHWALKDISFRAECGECLGIVGPNGAGKSTLLKILSRALYPTAGSFEVRGRVISLLELGTGFHPDLTGIQNIFISARLLGFSEEEITRRLPAILDFAELGDFVNRPLHIYSSGMYVRLAFSLFACLEPDV